MAGRSPDSDGAVISDRASMREAAERLRTTQVSDLSVVDDGGNYLGVLSEGDLLSAMVPDCEGLIEADVSPQDACAIFRQAGAWYADQPIRPLVIQTPITLSPDDELLKAATIMLTRHIRRLPVVEDGRLIGSVSRADVCWVLLATENEEKRA